MNSMNRDLIALLMAAIFVFIFFVTCGCVDSPTKPQEPTVHVTFDTVPHQYYSQNPQEFVGINILTTIDPPQEHEWCIDANWFRTISCGTASKFNKGGHRIYLQRNHEWTLTVRTKIPGQQWLHYGHWTP